LFLNINTSPFQFVYLLNACPFNRHLDFNTSRMKKLSNGVELKNNSKIIHIFTIDEYRDVSFSSSPLFKFSIFVR